MFDRSYEFNPDELGEKLIIGEDKVQLPVKVVTKCPAGTYLRLNVTCEPCPPGQYQTSQVESESKIMFMYQHPPTPWFYHPF